MADWIKKNVESLRSLQGSFIERWICLEMALREIGSDGRPQWIDESVPFLQLCRLDLQLSNGNLRSIITYQNDDQWGLCQSDDLPPLELGSTKVESIYRKRELDEFPVGQIELVEVFFDESGDISGVNLKIGGHRVSLKAGEIYEQPDGSLKIITMDESILVQID